MQDAEDLLATRNETSQKDHEPKESLALPLPAQPTCNIMMNSEYDSNTASSTIIPSSLVSILPSHIVVKTDGIISTLTTHPMMGASRFYITKKEIFLHTPSLWIIIYRNVVHRIP
jgi:hypothetical protein